MILLLGCIIASTLTSSTKEEAFWVYQFTFSKISNINNFIQFLCPK